MLVGIFPVESLLLSNFSSCCLVVSRGGFAGISSRIFLICTRVWYSLDHLERSDCCHVLLVMVWYGMVWYGMVWYGMVWYGMVWYGMVWYGMVW